MSMEAGVDGDVDAALASLGVQGDLALGAVENRPRWVEKPRWFTSNTG